MCKIIKYCLSIVIFLTSNNGLPGGDIANKYFLDKQKFLFDIVQHVEGTQLNEELLRCGQKGWERDPIKYLEFNKIMKDFERSITLKLLLKRQQKFSLSHQPSLKELKGLFYLFYYAKDWETLKMNICWARLHIHPQMFIFALTQALMKRQDFFGLMLPKVYEIWPQHFFEGNYIRQLEAFNYDQWHWEEFVYRNVGQKEQDFKWINWRTGYIYEETEKLMEPSNIYGNLRNSSKWREALKEVSLYYMNTKRICHHPTLFESDSYLFEDKEWQAYWYYINMGLWLYKDLKNIFSNELRDWWFWNLQQIVTRHKLAKSTQLLQKPMELGLIDFRGYKFKSLDSQDKVAMEKWLYSLQYLTQTALNEQTYRADNQTQLTLHFLPNLEAFLSQHYDIGHILEKLMPAHSHQQNPNFVSNFETMLRDEIFFIYGEILLRLYRSLKTTFDPYKVADYSMETIQINSVNVSKLSTYFEYVDADVSNLMRPSHLYYHGRLLWYKSLMLRQRQLQHQPFSMEFNISSEKPQVVIVRTFLQLQCQKARYKCPHLDYLQLDTFVTNLAIGYNIIVRHSQEFYSYSSPSLTYTELYHFTQLALDDRFDFTLNFTTGNCRFPHHLMLPRGMNGEGLPVNLIFVVTPYNYRFHKANNLNCDFSDGIITFDGLPPGFPFDRAVDEGELFGSGNVLVKKMKIYHSDEVKIKEKS